MTCVLVVACMVFRCHRVPAMRISDGMRPGFVHMIVVGVFAHNVASSILDETSYYADLYILTLCLLSNSKAKFEVLIIPFAEGIQII
jgi:hypothetical protein